jgi:hypothetical protein
MLLAALASPYQSAGKIRIYLPWDKQAGLQDLDTSLERGIC